MKKSFVWHDGGRAEAGFVGHTQDCAIRAIAIATGYSYSKVYDEIFKVSGRTPREGVSLDLINKYLTELGFHHTQLPYPTRFLLLDVIQGVSVVRFAPIEGKRSGHVCTVVDGTIYDTWDASVDGRFLVDQYWTAPVSPGVDRFAVAPSARRTSKRQQINNDAMARVIERIRKMRNTANNSASTQGEIENAMRMASTMMLQYQLTDDDLKEDSSETSGYGSLSIFVTGIRAASWEKQLAAYVSKLFGDAFYFIDTDGKHRTKIVFFGPIDSVESAGGLFTELLLEIATLGRLKYGGYAKGRGASYCEGFVSGLREMLTGQSSQSPALIETSKQISARLEVAAQAWLYDECGIELRLLSRSGRSGHDENAAADGQRDGRSRVVAKPGQLRIGS